VAAVSAPYKTETQTVLHGRMLPVPRHYVKGPLRTFRASSRADAEYLATVLNSITADQHMVGLNTATAEYTEAAE